MTAVEGLRVFARRARRVDRRRAALRAVRHAVLWAGAGAVVVAAGGQLLGLYPPRTALLLPLAAAVAAAVAGALRPRTTGAVLLDIDRRLGLRERLSAAWEAVCGRRPTGLDRLVVEDAAASISGLRPAEAFPRLSIGRGLAPALVVAVLGAAAIPDWGMDLSAGPTEETRIQGEILEDLGARLAAGALEDYALSSLELAEQLQELGRRLQDERIGERRAQALIRDLTERVREQVRDLERDLGSRADRQPPEDEGTVDSGPPPAGALGPAESEARRLLRWEDLSEEERRLAAESVREPGARDRGGDLLAVPRDVAEELGLAEQLEALRDVESRLATLAGSGEGDGGEVGGEGAGSGEAGDPGERGDGGTVTGGREAGDQPQADEFRTPFGRRAGEEQPLEELRGRVEETEERHRSLVRARTPGSPAAGPALAVDQSYQRQVEEVIRRERVPEELRPLVADYFLRMGIGREESSDRQSDQQ